MSKETREIALRIAHKRFNFIDDPEPRIKGLIRDIDQALQDERKRPVKIVGAALKRLDALNACCAVPMRAVLKAIRNGVADAK